MTTQTSLHEKFRNLIRLYSFTSEAKLFNAIVKFKIFRNLHSSNVKPLHFSNSVLGPAGRLIFLHRANTSNWRSTATQKWGRVHLLLLAWFLMSVHHSPFSSSQANTPAAEERHLQHSGTITGFFIFQTTQNQQHLFAVCLANLRFPCYCYSHHHLVTKSRPYKSKIRLSQTI